MQDTKFKVRTHYPRWVRGGARLILRLCGWQIEGSRPDVNKCVVIAAPHTTNWDLPAMLLTSMSLDIPCAFMMKDNAFWWPAGILWRWLSGIEVNRRVASNMVDQVVTIVKSREAMFLLIAPEGTRKHVDNQWKLGFYWIAMGAGIPLLLSFVDYKHKRVGVGVLIHLTGDLDDDFRQFQAFYEPKVGVRPTYRPKDGERYLQEREGGAGSPAENPQGNGS